MLALIENHSIASRTFVNCSRNMWGPYAALRSQCVAGVSFKLHIDVFGSLWGFACNAVHFLELLRWITGSVEITCTDAQLKSSPFGNKRGRQYEEFVGTAAFRTDRGDTIELTSSGDSAQPAGISVLGKATQGGAFAYLIEESAGFTFDLVRGTKQSFTPAFVSTTTKMLIETVLGKIDADLSLPSVEQAAISHRALFEALSLATGRDRFAIT
jgi:hypothetical protein